MNNTPLDYVLSLPSPPPRFESASGPVRPRDNAPRFDSHFRKESETRESSSPPPAQAPASPPAEPPRNKEKKAEDDHPVQGSNEVAPPTDNPRDDKKQDGEETAAATADGGQPTPVVAAVVAEQTVVAEVNALADAPQDQHVVADGKQRAAAKDALETGIPTKPHSVEPNAEAQPETTSATLVEGAIESAAEPPADANAKTAEAQTGMPVTAAATDPSQVEQTAAEAAPTDEPSSEPHVKTKPNKNTGNRAPSAGNGTRGDVHNDDRTQTRAAASDQAVKIASAVPSENPAAAAVVDKSSDDGKNDKRIEPKATAVTKDEPTPGRPTVAAASRAATLDPAAPVVANVDSQLAAEAPPDAPETDLKSQPVRAAAKEGLLSPFARLERGGPLNTHANRAGGNREAGPHVDPARFVSRVARAVQTAHERGTPLQLRLSPPELGTMRLELTVRGGALTASIETDNAKARQVLLDNLPALRDRLAEQSVRIERFDVDVRRDGTGDGSGGGGRPNTGPQEQGQQQRHTAPHRTNTGRGAASRATSDAPPPPRRTITNTSINVIA